jgi:UDP-2,3-diacylglucosamine hydrolase
VAKSVLASNIDVLDLVESVKLSGNDAALFVSDIHLCDDHPEIAANFHQSLNVWMKSHSHLFVLGDLFEAWCGDDGPDKTAQGLIEKFKALANEGKQIFIMRGNRDFLIDVALVSTLNPHPPLTQQCGAQLLADVCQLGAWERDFLLCHGDILCSLDTEYLKARQILRSPEWQENFLRNPLEVRKSIALQMRQQSFAHQAIADVHPEKYDATNEAIQRLFNDYSASTLIHGHTHRPAVHELGDKRRYVLSDWSAVRGDALSLTKTGLVRLLC